jgi:tetratricopeptide (TPR) repeat protein
MNPQAPECLSPQAHKERGNAFLAAGNLEAAQACYRSAIARDPLYAPAWNNLSHVLKEKQRWDEAEQAARKALALEPALAMAWKNLAEVLSGKGCLDEAIAAWGAYLALQGDDIDALCACARLHYRQRRLEEAQQLLWRAREGDHASRTQQTDIELGLANIASERGDTEQAAQGFERLAQFHDEPRLRYYYQGCSARERQRWADVLDHLSRALAMDPHHVGIRWDYAHVLLRMGQWREGFAHYEVRLDAQDADYFPETTNMQALLPYPRWQGESLQGKSLLLWMEQGFGDALMMLRFVPRLLAQQPRTLSLLCEPHLQRLSRQIAGLGDILISPAQAAAQKMDFHCPLMSLPYRLEVEETEWAQNAAWVRPPAAMVEAWAPRWAGLTGKRIGLVWAGNPRHTHNSQRSMAFAQLKPLWAIPGIDWISLQKTVSAPSPVADQALTDVMAQCADFLDTAALIAHLDAVIGVDTAVIHLAASMGKPTVLLNANPGDWRWLIDREDSPWYPTMRIFRQPAPGDWLSVIDALCLALARGDVWP